MAEQMRSHVATLLRGIDRYNPENLPALERYIGMQARENTYDLEANLAVLKLYQFNPIFYQASVASLILLKALTNLPHTDFVLCKCLMDQVHLEEEPSQRILLLSELLETCKFKEFWVNCLHSSITGITGFEDSIRKFICHVVGITYQTIERSLLQDLLGGISDAQLKQWMTKYGWKEGGNHVYIANQEENIKTKNITEKIEFEHVAAIMAMSK
ncbi:PREDICTED: eukaryotic translation initiation factor 3 subunit K-like [Priapulus caudatus]|uniref:Eukaryotic translation initiation factor 3 subunit K n=1 Tax=Priapulus caudatus TaxID=37621 RepID=A0ABM1FAL6_PRICU|nr:PREDICTED: eukaryotic translation initiation factor 3 subunit K-like [Priapulus caudatus]